MQPTLEATSMPSKTDDELQSRVCRACDRRYDYPVPRSPATRFYCEQCADLPHGVRAVVERLNKRVRELERTVLGPPGAKLEREFLDTCFRCGACADVCPAKCIILMPGGGDDEQTGTPYVDPDLRACVICDELACMKACPSGALRLVGKFE